MQGNDDALELLATERDENAAADDRVAAASSLDGIGEDAIDRHRQRDVTKKRHKECLHEGGEAARFRGNSVRPRGMRSVHIPSDRRDDSSSFDEF